MVLHTSHLPLTPMQYNVREWKETWALLNVRFPDWNLMAIFASHYTDNGFREWVINIWADVWWLNQFFWPNWFGSLVIWVIPTLDDVTSLQSKTWLKWSKTQTVFAMGFKIRFCSLMKRGFLQNGWNIYWTLHLKFRSLLSARGHKAGMKRQQK